MSCWNFAETVYRLGAGAAADRPALIHDDLIISYGELRHRASGIATYLNSLNLPAGSHVGHYLRNSNAYMEMFVGSGLAGHAHVNVNYRYRDDELIGLANGLDLRVIVYDAEFAERVMAIRERLEPTVAFIEVGGDEPVADFAVSLTSLYDQAPEDFETRTSSDDFVLIATGGTTGLPKGTQWRNEDLWRKMGTGTQMALEPLQLKTHPAELSEHVSNVESLSHALPFLSLSPLMHGAGLMTAILMISQGVPVATVSGVRFDPDATLSFIKQHKVGCVVLVGDAFGTPLVDALDKRPDEDLIASLAVLISSGASLGPETRQGLQRHNPKLAVVDTLGSSESSGYAMATGEPGVFAPLPKVRVLDDELNDVVPGSDTIGMVYYSGYKPVGYYNAPEKSAETFPEIDGQRYVMTGDRCTVREDGNLVLLGRDSTVVNTGGEKVYTVEVERVLVDHPAITDALVVGLPHPRFGKMVVAVVEGPDLDSASLDVESVRAHVAEHLADYKVPREVLAIDSLQRAPNGKPDYGFVTDYAAGALTG